MADADMQALMVAEQIWEWRVRALFAVICAIAVVIAIVTYLIWEKKDRLDGGGRVRKCFGRLCVALLVACVAELGFFKDVPSAGILVATAAVIGIAGLRMPAGESGAPEPVRLDDRQDRAEGQPDGR